MRNDGRLADTALRAWGGKLAGNTARVAAVLHATETAPTTMPHEKEVDHAIAVHDLAITDSDRGRAIQVLDWIKRSGKSSLTVREVQQSLKQRADFRRAADVRAAFQVLQEHGWLFRLHSEQSLGRPSEPFLVHPELLP